MKLALYSNSSYCLSFGNDCVFLDIEVEITREHEQRKEFSAVVKKCQLDPSQEAFPVYMLNYFTPEALQNFRNDLIGKLLEEISPQLFSLFYSSDLIDTTETTPETKPNHDNTFTD